MSPEIRQRLFDEIIAFLKQNGHADDFSQSLGVLDRAFRHAAEVHGQPYGDQHQETGQRLYFAPFSESGRFWRYSIEILNVNGIYAVFDRTGRYALYEQNGNEFGRLVFANPPENSIAWLEGCMAGDMISNIVALRKECKDVALMNSNRIKNENMKK